MTVAGVISRLVWFSLALMVLAISLVLNWMNSSKESFSFHSTTTSNTPSSSSSSSTTTTTRGTHRIKSIILPSSHRWNCGTTQPLSSSSSSHSSSSNVTLYYVETGDLSENSYPVLQFHPTPGSLLFRHEKEDELLKKYGIRLIKVDRSNLYLQNSFCCASKSEQFIQFDCIYKHLIEQELKLKPSYSVLGYQMGGFMALNHYHVLSKRRTHESMSKIDSIVVIAPLLPPIQKKSSSSSSTTTTTSSSSSSSDRSSSTTSSDTIDKNKSDSSCLYTTTLLYKIYSLLGDKLAYKILNPLWKVQSKMARLFLSSHSLTHSINRMSFKGYSNHLSQENLNILDESTHRMIHELNALSTLFEEYHILLSNGLKREENLELSERNDDEVTRRRTTSHPPHPPHPPTLVMVTSAREEEKAHSFLMDASKMIDSKQIRIQRVETKKTFNDDKDDDKQGEQHSSLDVFVSEYERALSFIVQNKPSSFSEKLTNKKEHESVASTMSSSTPKQPQESTSINQQQQQQQLTPKTTSDESSHKTTSEPTTTTDSSSSSGSSITASTSTSSASSSTDSSTDSGSNGSTRTSSSPPTIAVIGGGLAGLSAAIEAAELGAKVYLLEKEDRTGK